MGCPGTSMHLEAQKSPKGGAEAHTEVSQPKAALDLQRSPHIALTSHHEHPRRSLNAAPFKLLKPRTLLPIAISDCGGSATWAKRG